MTSMDTSRASPASLPVARRWFEATRLAPGLTVLEVLHLPGHSPGGIGLFDPATGTLFAGDAIYDGPLIFEGPGTSVPDYVRTFDKLVHLDVRRVHGGHDPSFGPARMHEIIERHLRAWEDDARSGP